MKERKQKNVWRSFANILLFAVVLLSPSVAMADNGWKLVFQNAEGETVKYPMSEVGSLVAVDEAYDFTILSINGSVLAEGVLKVSFESDASSGISPVVPQGNMIAQPAADKLTLIGLSGEVTVYDAAGRPQVRVTATGGETVVSIGHLPAGAYVMKAGSQTFKFMKK